MKSYVCMDIKRSDGTHVLDLEQCKNDVFVCTTPTVVHDLCYDLLELNLLYHRHIRTDNTIIIQFSNNRGLFGISEK